MAVQKIKLKSGKLKYRAYWRNPVTGKLEYGTLTTKAKAEKESDSILFRLKHERDSFEAPAPESTEVTFAVLAEEYLSRRIKRDVTRKQTFYHLKTIAPHIGDLPAAKISKVEMRQMMAAMESDGLKQNTIHTRVTLVKTVLNWAVEEGIIEGHALLFFRCRRGHDLQIPPPTQDEIRRIRDNAEPHLKRAILLGYFLGLRFGESELLRLRWENVDLDRGVVRAESAAKNEGMQWREIDIHPELMPSLAAWCVEDDGKGWLIHYPKRNPKTGKLEPAQVTTIKRAWATAKRRAGITRRLRPYDLRHAFATDMIAAGADAKTASALMGHSTTAMVHKHYQHVLDRQRKAAIKNLPGLDGQGPEAESDCIQELHTKDPSSAPFLYATEKKVQ